ncbi:hypothetical protein CC1G_03797 [Coprinopsis cinerea okayama7|uniref:G-patch domain-containing protein n=1 Tax=Coprinopsis cinerea (strain Okayama-7 / 130 / ATCC MYA-4618 / FGSC 9003) TaxID=240176 RepID=A8NGR5_COPC7|nr:hypothetical protein CC1G_03797 [Coprinopsis cinerea okayama7\|eukprot:XP_001833580.2 hypothetical protein CC1G_03797 [Coprinopsis cinerea okayama7\
MKASHGMEAGEAAIDTMLGTETQTITPSIPSDENTTMAYVVLLEMDANLCKDPGVLMSEVVQGYQQGYDYDAQAYDDGYGGYGQGRHGSDYGNHHHHHNHQQHHRQQHHRDQDYGYDERPRGGGGGGGGHPKKRLLPSEPSPHVIFLGLDPDFTEADVCVSKGFGFAQFASTEHAKAFVDPQFPFIQMPPPASHGASATQEFYKALETGAPHTGRRVKIDYSQSASPGEKARQRANMNDGTRDIGNSPGPVLLFRGLDPLSGPQAIHQAMLYSAGPGKQGAKGMRRIILVKDKVTMASFGFAFVEFVDVESASTVLANSMSAQLHPNGFRISDKPVAASFAHSYSFQPVTDFLQRDEACLQSTMSLGGVEGQWVRYWDETSTVAVLEFKVEEPAKASAPSKEKKEKRKKDDSKANAIPTASILPLTDKPVTLSLNKGPVKIGLGANPAKSLTSGVSLDDSTIEDETPTEPNKPMPVKRVAPLISSKKTVNNINKWNQVQEELHTDPDATPAQAQAKAKSVEKDPVAIVSGANSTRAKSIESSPVPAEDELEFADVKALTCLLCSRQLKSLDLLKKHSLASDLHKKNLKDENLKEVARQKVASRRAASAPAKEEPPKYRDRASERRTLFNQPEAPLPEHIASNGSVVGKKRYAEGPPRPPTPPPPPLNPGQDESNVGNKLLKMMGWKEGTGLGAEGEGRTDPIETAIYAQGVGLGASKGKDISSLSGGYSGYVQMAQEAARERYGS